MSDPVFAPAKKPAGAVAPGNAQLVYLREVLFAIKGIYHHPLSDADAPLPPHRWALVEPGEKLSIEGTTSDANGVSTILRPDQPKGTAEADWDLWLIPMFEDKKSSSEIVDKGEVWIDVDKNQWVRPSEVPDLTRIETRRLLRIPRWSSFRHVAAFDGKFREPLPGSTEFEKRGRIKNSELAPHGTLDKPWTIAIDEGWMHTFVQFRFYDPIQKKERPVPKGLILEALGMTNLADGAIKEPMRVGASSVTRDDGSIYVLHSRAEAKATDLDYQFATPDDTTFAYADGTFQSTKLEDLARLEKEYPVAPMWHSYGHESWEGAVDASASVRKSFISIRAKGTTAASPICFHLDDLVLSSLTAPITVPANQRLIGIYTTLAALHDPQQANGADVPYSKLQASTNLRAEDAMFRRGKGFDQMTRFIDYEGDLYDVSTKFATGIVGTTAYIGARAADLATPIEDNSITAVQRPDTTSGHRTYLFDTRWLHHTHNGVNARLAHLVCYVSVFIDGTQLHPTNADAVGVVENLLVDSSNRWDQKHPGIPGSSSAKKDYVIIPEKGFKTDSTLMKVRHVFARRSLILLDTNTPPLPKPIVVQIDSQPGRATGGRTMRLYCQSGPNMNVPPNPAWLTATPPGTLATRPYQFEPTQAGTSERLDNETFTWFTFAHELGHESGLLDEYLEGIDGRTLVSSVVATQFVPRFDQWGIRARPYFLDTFGMMQSNQLPRLRYIWNYFDALHRNTSTLPASHWFYSEAPFVSQYIAGARTLTHAIPRSSASWLSNRGGPWTATTGTQGDCNLSFYPTSHDEGMIGPGVLDTGLIKAGEEFDGILVIHPMIWVSFTAAITEWNGFKWNRFANWATKYFVHSTTPHFAISTPTASDAKRVVVVFQPRFEFGPAPTTPQTIANATLELRIGRGGAAPTYTVGAPPVLTCDENDVGPWILRYALRTKPAVPAVSQAPTTAADLTMLPGALATMLGRPEIGTVVAYNKA